MGTARRWAGLLLAASLAACADGATHMVEGLRIFRDEHNQLCPSQLMGVRAGKAAGKLGCCVLDKSLHLTELADALSRCAHADAGSCWYVDTGTPASLHAEILKCCMTLGDGNPGCEAMQAIDADFTPLIDDTQRCVESEPASCKNAFEDSAVVLQKVLAAAVTMYKFQKHVPEPVISLSPPTHYLLDLCGTGPECLADLTYYLTSQRKQNHCFNKACLNVHIKPKPKPDMRNNRQRMAGDAYVRHAQTKAHAVPKSSQPQSNRGREADDDDYDPTEDLVQGSTECGPGKYKTETKIDDTQTQAVCAKCPIGKFQAKAQGRACLRCPRGKYQPYAAGRACIKIAGKLTASPSQAPTLALTPAPTPAETTRQAAGNAKRYCSAGHVGTRTTVGGLSVFMYHCHPCATNTYKPLGARPAAACRSCPRGKTSAPGKTKCTAPVATKPSSRSPSVAPTLAPTLAPTPTFYTHAKGCPRGEYAVFKTTTKAEKPPTMLFWKAETAHNVTTVTQVKCSSCPHNKYQDESKGFVCKVCPPGRFQPEPLPRNGLKMAKFCVSTFSPTALPTAYPTPRSPMPTPFPTAVPTTKAEADLAMYEAHLTRTPTGYPTKTPTATPTAHPTRFPTALPTAHPTYKKRKKLPKRAPTPPDKQRFMDPDIQAVWQQVLHKRKAAKQELLKELRMAKQSKLKPKPNSNLRQHDGVVAPSPGNITAPPPPHGKLHGM